MSYWASYPKKVLRLKNLTDGELRLWLLISDNLTPAGYCKLTNAEISKALNNLSQQTISARISSLAKKKFINIVQNNHKHERWMYVHVPKEQELYAEEKPDDEKLSAQMLALQESFKTAVIFGSAEPDLLLARIKESPVLDSIQDNSIQYALTLDQVKFLAEFMYNYPHKAIDCQVASYTGLDFSQLIGKIDDSNFLQKANNLGLKWCLDNSDKIMAGTHDNFRKEKPKQNFTGRSYTRGQLNALFQDIDDIEI